MAHCLSAQPLNGNFPPSPQIQLQLKKAPQLPVEMRAKAVGI